MMDTTPTAACIPVDVECVPCAEATLPAAPASRWGALWSDSFLQGSAVLFVGTMVGNVCNYFFQFFMSRHLSVEDFGAMNSLMSLMMIGAVPAMSILLVSTKYVSGFKARGEWEKVRLFHKKVFLTVAKFGAAALAVLLLLAPTVALYLKIDSALPVVAEFLGRGP